MSSVPHIPGVLSADEVIVSATHLASLQNSSGMIMWYPGGHSDPWNHVESAMALDVAGFHTEAERAYEWLADIQRPDGNWHNYYLPDGDRDDTVEDTKLDTNVCAYIATGVWHHWRCTGDRGSSTTCGRPSSERSTGCCRCGASTGWRCGPSNPMSARGITHC